MTASLPEFREQFNKEFIDLVVPYLDQAEKITSGTPVYKIISNIIPLLSGGKRIRPYLIWVMSNTTGWSQDALRAMAAIELLHIFCLIHDDIIDESEYRHGTPTLNAYLYKATGDKHYAYSQSLLAGDFIFGIVWQIVSEISSPELQKNITAILNTTIHEVVLGQMLDVYLGHSQTATTETLSTKNRFKTARYTFTHPIEIGLVLAGRKLDQEAQEFCAHFGDAAGEAFQMKDDLLDGKAISGKTRFLDIQQGQPTLITYHIEAFGTDKHKKLLKKYYGRKKCFSSKDEKRIEQLLLDSGAYEYAERILTDQISKATGLINETAFLDDHQRVQLIAITQALNL